MNRKLEVKPNIVFILSDQQRFDTLGCNGQSLPVTPNLDRLAKEGVNFKNAYTVQPVCGPARACLQTGKYPTKSGCYRNAASLPIDADTLAKRMKRAGYNTAYVGKWHLASDETENHFETTAVPMNRRGGYEDYWMASDVLEFTSHGYDGYVYDKDNRKVEFNGYRADCITDFALDYIKNHEENSPFFLFLSHIEPHHQNDRNDYEGPEGSRERFSKFENPKDLEIGKGDWERFMPDYLGCCHSLDYNVGRVVNMLKQKEMYENTILIYTSDHGCHFKNNTDKVQDGYDDYKRNSFENTIHVPMIIKGGVFSGGKEEKRLVSLLDLPKTIATMAGGDVRGMQGITLWDSVGLEKRNGIYIQISESYVGRAIRSDRYKYVIWDRERHPWKEAYSCCYTEKYLFDLKTDPLEKHNLLNDKSHRDTKLLLKKWLLEMAEEAGERPFEIKEE